MTKSQKQTSATVQATGFFENQDVGKATEAAISSAKTKGFEEARVAAVAKCGDDNPDMEGPWQLQDMSTTIDEKSCIFQGTDKPRVDDGIVQRFWVTAKDCTVTVTGYCRGWAKQIEEPKPPVKEETLHLPAEEDRSPASAIETSESIERANAERARELEAEMAALAKTLSELDDQLESHWKNSEEQRKINEERLQTARKSCDGVDGLFQKCIASLCGSEIAEGRIYLTAGDCDAACKERQRKSDAEYAAKARAHNAKVTSCRTSRASECAIEGNRTTAECRQKVDAQMTKSN